MAESLKNITFTLMAKSRTDAEAIAEAYRLIQHHSGDMGIEVRCGGDLIATVDRSGDIAVPNKKR